MTRPLLRLVTVAFTFAGVSFGSPASAEELKAVGNENDGFVMDGRFLHRALNFQFELSENTVIQNEPARIVLTGTDWNGSLSVLPASADLSAQMTQAFAAVSAQKVKLASPVIAPVQIGGVNGLKGTSTYRMKGKDLVLTIAVLPWTDKLNIQMVTISTIGGIRASALFDTFKHAGQVPPGLIACGNVKALSRPDAANIATGHTIPCSSGLATGVGKVKFFYAHNLARPCELSGPFTNGLLNGKGEENCRDGSRFSGTYKDGLREGMGTMRSAEGNVHHGLFQQGTFWNGWSTNPRYGGGTRPDGLDTTYWIYANGRNTGMCRTDGNVGLEANCPPGVRSQVIEQALALNGVPTASGAPAVAGGSGGGGAAANATNAGQSAAPLAPPMNCDTIAFTRNTPIPSPNFAKYAVCREFGKRAGHSNFRFISFAKTDGQQVEFMKVQGYTLFYTAETEITSAVGSNGCQDGSSNQRWDCLQQAINKRANGMNPGRIKAGARDVFRGKVSFEKFESGWKFSSVTINGN